MIIPLIIAVLAFPSVVAVAGDVAVLEKCVVKSNTDVIAVGWQSGSSTGDARLL